jgi:hypothetical protein
MYLRIYACTLLADDTAAACHPDLPDKRKKKGRKRGCRGLDFNRFRCKIRGLETG